MRIMAIDYGDARTGVAFSDLTGSIVGRTTVIHERNTERLLAALTALIEQEQPGLLVMGFPRNMDGSCGAEDYLILQLRLRKGLDLEAYKALYGKQFSAAQLAFVQNCVRAGYATFDGRTLALTPAGLIVQNSILAQLL